MPPVTLPAAPVRSFPVDAGGRPPIRVRSIGSAAGFLEANEYPADTNRLSSVMVVAAILLVVLALVVRSRRDEATKLLREQTGLGLKEAKEDVERRQRRPQPN